MSRIRIEGLLSAFPKLMGSGKQYTYFETDTVRYVYQPIESLFLVLITNRSSNIVEDLETLRLLGRVIPDNCPTLEEETITEKAFNIMFAFDEVISLGYRENLTLEQIHTFLEMDSHEERLAMAIKQSKITEASAAAVEKARFLSKQKKTSGSESFGVSSENKGFGNSPTVPLPTAEEAPRTSPVTLSATAKKGMSLGTKKTGKEELLARMVKSGELEEHHAQRPSTTSSYSMPTHVSNISLENVHLKLDEKIVAVLNRDGGFQSLEVKGDLFLSISDSSNAAVKIHLNKEHNNDYAWKTHPNINKVSFSNDRVLQLKDPSKPFPVGSSLGILRWRLQTQGNFKPPLSVSCWPSGDSLTVEYDRADIVLTNVVISIPMGDATPSVTSIDYGSHKFDVGSQTLSWFIDRIDSSNGQGTIEINLDTDVDSSVFFPVRVNFFGEATAANVKVLDVLSNDTGLSVPYSSEVVLSVERYEIV